MCPSCDLAGSLLRPSKSYPSWLVVCGRRSISCRRSILIELVVDSVLCSTRNLDRDKTY